MATVTKPHDAHAENAFGMLFVLSLLSLLLGSVIALEIPSLLFLLLGAVGGIAFLFIPVDWVLWMLLLLSFVVIGPAVFFVPSLAQMPWIPPLASGLLFVRVAIERYRIVQPATVPAAGAFSLLLSGFFIIAILAAAYNASPWLQIIVAYKNYLAVWGVFFLLGWAIQRENTIRATWRALLAVMLIQLPFALYQHFFVSTTRAVSGRGSLGGVAIWDSVVGTFQGSADGGGQSGVLAVFVVAMMSFAFALWRERAWTGSRMLVFIALGFTTLLLGEVKIIVVLFPLAFLVIDWRVLTRSPVRFLSASLLGIVLLASTIVAYDKLYWNTGGAADKDLLTNLEEQAGYAFDTSSKSVDFVTGSISRAQAAVIWFEGNHDPVQWVIGHGPGASRSRSSAAIGEAAGRYVPLDIDAIGLTVLLWDVGIVGTFAWCLLTALGVLHALRLAASSRLSAFDRASLKGSAVILSFTLLTLAYNKSVVDVFTMEFLQMLALGTVIFWSRRTR